MNLDQSILAALRNTPTAPNNLFDMPRSELEKLGYKLLDSNEELVDNDLIAMTTKDQNMWAVLGDAKSYRRALKQPFVGNLIALRK